MCVSYVHVVMKSVEGDIGQIRLSQNAKYLFPGQITNLSVLSYVLRPLASYTTCSVNSMES